MAPGKKSSQKRYKDAIAQRQKAAEEASAAAAARLLASAATSAEAAAPTRHRRDTVPASASGKTAAPTRRRPDMVPSTASAETAAPGRRTVDTDVAGAGAAARVLARAGAGDGALVPTRLTADTTAGESSAERAAPTRARPLVPIPSLPDTGDMEPSSSSRGANASGGDPGNEINVSGPLLSIRCSKKNAPEIVDMNTGKEPDPKKRGIVTGMKTLFNKRENNNQPIVIKYDPQHRGPSTKEHRSMMSRDIGSAVRTKVPMLKPKFLDLSVDQRPPFEDYLKDLYHLLDTEVDLCIYIDRTAVDICREWKHDCHMHYLDVSKATPEEFIHWPEEWEWLKTHFEDPEFKKLSAKNTANRNKGKEAGTAINHHSGTTPYSFRVAAIQKKGSLAPLLQTVCDVYGPS